MDEASNLGQPIGLGSLKGETVEQTPLAEPKKKSNAFIIVVLILIVLILGGSAYLFFTNKLDIGIENPLNKETENITEEENEESAEYVMKNEGWALLSLPEYGLSAKIPSYTMDRNMDSVIAKSSWKASIAEGIDHRTEYYKNYVNSVSINFLPEDLSLFACGEGCLKEHTITIHIFANSDSKSLDEVKSVYFQNWKNEEDGISEITSEQVERWGLDVSSFTAKAEMEDITGYVVVNRDFVYVMTYHLTTKPDESYQIGLKVLDSLEFGK